MLAILAARGVNIFVVHAPGEVTLYASYLRVPPERIVFVPIQRGVIEYARQEDLISPFILSMGSAQRDYASLVAAVTDTGIRTIIITRPDIIATLPKTDEVELRSGLTQAECLEVLAGAAFSVIPISNMTTASGQITIVTSMRLGVAVVATRCPGTEGYIEDGVTGSLVAPFDVAGLRQAILELWRNVEVRNALALQGKHHADHNFSDEGAAQALHAIIASL